MKPLRSILYVPADNERALAKAPSLNADGFIFDLEDAVSTLNKQQARMCLVDALTSIDYQHSIKSVRVNGIDSQEVRHDLEAIRQLKIDAIVFPKIDSHQDLHTAITLLEEFNIPNTVAVWSMVETPKAILNLPSITSTSQRLTTLVLGTSDLAKEMNIPHSPDRLGFIYALSHAVYCAKACGLQVLDGVHLDLNDERQFIEVLEQGVKLGFDGKTLIHPKQISACNKIFSPSGEQIEDAKQIIQLWQEMQASKKGVALHKGCLIEKLHVEQAYQLLEREY